MLQKTFILLLTLCTLVFSQDSDISRRISPPDGFSRISFPEKSFSRFVQTLPLKKTDQILMHGGGTAPTLFAGYNIYAVVDMPMLFSADIEQCADYSMRFWAEYHKAGNKLDKLYLFDYNGNKKLFSSSGKSYSSFLKWAFSYSNSFSLKKGCKALADSLAIPGDMVVQNEGGGIGHVSMIVDMCKNIRGQKLYLIGYSFMPAQEFHIEKAEKQYGINGWFTLEGYYRYLADHLDLGLPTLRRFAPL